MSGGIGRFGAQNDLAQTLLAHLPKDQEDGAHDLSHILRVWRNVRQIAAEEGGDLRLLCAATVLHDAVNVPKDSPLRAKASRLAADKARGWLSALGWTLEDEDAVAHAIEAHSFSANITPKTLEARILQDADRLDAIGYLGIARCFHVSGQLGRSLYDPEDPAAESRNLDDLTYAIDHFPKKLLTLADGLTTQTGRKLAKARHKTLEDFLRGFLQEVAAG